MGTRFAYVKGAYTSLVAKEAMTIIRRLSEVLSLYTNSDGHATRKISVAMFIAWNEFQRLSYRTVSIRTNTKESIEVHAINADASWDTPRAFSMALQSCGKHWGESPWENTSRESEAYPLMDRIWGKIFDKKGERDLCRHDCWYEQKACAVQCLQPKKSVNIYYILSGLCGRTFSKLLRSEACKVAQRRPKPLFDATKTAATCPMLNVCGCCQWFVPRSISKES